MPYAAIKLLLHPDIIKNIDQENGRVQLKETASEAKLKPIWLYGLDDHAVVFKLDHKRFTKKSAFLNPRHIKISTRDATILSLAGIRIEMSLFFAS